MRKSTDFIIDHCSVEWSVDECLSAYENKNFTAQYCIISESLNNSGHDKDAHGYGGIWGGINASFHHNLISTHKARMPRIGSSATVSTYNGQPDTDSLIDIRNNVFYNYRSTIGYGGENGTRVNFVNNYYKPSKYSSDSVNFYKPYSGENGSTTLHLSGNYMEGREGFNADNWSVMAKTDGLTKCESISDGITVDGVLKRNDEYIYRYPVTTATAPEAYSDVIENAGSSLVRDYTDARIIRDVINGTTPQGSNGSKGLIDSQEDVGSWNGLYGAKEQDSDLDGIPDYWEDENGLDKSNPSDSTEISPTGYTYLEDYANEIVLNSYNSTDKWELWTAMNYTAKLNPSLYFEATWEPVDKAFEAAKTVVGDRSASQEEIDSAYAALNSALAGLTEDKRSELIAAVSAAEELDRNKYANEGYNSLMQLVEQGKEILKGEYDESLVMSQAEKINSAISALEESGRVRLRETMDRYGSYENDDWTEDSYSSFIAAINQANSVCSDYNAGEEAYLSAEAAIRTAYGALVPVYTAERELLDFEDMASGEQITVLKKDGFVMFNNGGGGKFSVISEYGGKVCLIPSGSKDLEIKPAGSFEEKGIYAFETDFKFTADECNLTIINVGGISISKSYYSLNPKIYGLGEGTVETEESLYPNRWNSVKVIVDTEKNTADIYLNGKCVVKNGTRSGQLSYVRFPNQSYAENDLYVDNLSVTKRIYPQIQYLYGDADVSGCLTANDAACLLAKALNGAYQMPMEYKADNWLKYADVSSDGIIAADDAAYVLQKVLNSELELPVENREDTTEPTTAEPTTTTVTETAQEGSTEPTTGEPVEPQQLIFDSLEADSLPSPYSSGAITLTSKDGDLIKLVEKEHNGYVKAIDGDTVDITVNVTSKARVDIYYASKTGYVYIDDSPYPEPYMGDDIMLSYTVTKSGRVVLRNAYIYAVCIE